MRPVALPILIDPPWIAMEPLDVVVPLLLALAVASTVAPSITTELLPLIATVLPVVLTCAPPLMVVFEAVVEPGAEPAEPIRIAPADPDPVAWDSISPEPLICRGATVSGAKLMSPPPPEPEALLVILLLEPSWRDPLVRLMEPPCPEPEDAEES